MEASVELDSLSVLLDALDRDSHSPDDWTYAWGKTEYAASKFYKFYFREIKPLACLPLIWKSKCQMKHKVFAWLLMIDRLNTRDLLARRQCPIENTNCVVCMQQREDRDHLFFSCTFSKTCWSAMGITWDLTLPLADRIIAAANVWRKPFFLEYVILGAWNMEAEK
jgi:hypothetical protein